MNYIAKRQFYKLYLFIRLETFMKNIDAKSALRLMESGELSYDHVKCSITVRGMGRLMFVQQTDYCRQYQEGPANTGFNDYAISAFTNGSNTETDTDCGIFYNNLDISVSFRFPNACTVFETEIYTINIVANRISQFSLHLLRY